MANRRAKKMPSKPKKAPRRMIAREARAAYGEIQKGVTHLEKSIADVQRGLRRAEQKIEADARLRVRALRKEVRDQLRVLQGKRREVARTLKHLSSAAGESWREIKRSADSLLSDARATASSVVDRFRDALKA